MQTQSRCATHSSAATIQRFCSRAVATGLAVAGLLALFTEPAFSGDRESPVVEKATEPLRSVYRLFERRSDRMNDDAVLTASLVSPDAFSNSAIAPSARTSVAIGADGMRVPLFFGFVEFDLDPDAPGGVPGFGPMSR